MSVLNADGQIVISRSEGLPKQGRGGARSRLGVPQGV